MTPDELRTLIGQIQANPAQATDDQLGEAIDAIRAAVTEQRDATPSPDTVAALTELRDARNTVTAEQTSRSEAAAQTADQAERLLAEFDEPEQDQVAEQPGGDTGDQVVTDTTEPAGAAAEGRELVSVAASLASVAEAVARFAPPATGAAPAPANRPQGRTAGRIGQPPATPAPPREAVTVRVRAAGGSGGVFQHGQDIGSSAEHQVSSGGSGGGLSSDRRCARRDGGGSTAWCSTRSSIVNPRVRSVEWVDRNSCPPFAAMPRSMPAS